MSLVVKTLLLSGSNLAFMAPAILAARVCLYYESVIFTLLTVISGIYHITDTVPSIDHIIFSRHAWQMLDFHFSFALITKIIVMILFNTNYEESDLVESYKKLIIKIMINVITDSLTVLLVIDGINTLTTILILLACCFICILIASIFIKPTIIFGIAEATCAIILQVIGICCYIICGSCEYYWIIHTIWHICIAFSMLFIMESKSCILNACYHTTKDSYLTYPSCVNQL